MRCLWELQSHSKAWMRMSLEFIKLCSRTILKEETVLLWTLAQFSGWWLRGYRCHCQTSISSPRLKESSVLWYMGKDNLANHEFQPGCWKWGWRRHWIARSYCWWQGTIKTFTFFAVEREEPHFRCFIGGVPTMEDVVSLTMLPMYGERNTMGVLLKRMMKRSLQFFWPLPWRPLKRLASWLTYMVKVLWWGRGKPELAGAGDHALVLAVVVRAS